METKDIKIGVTYVGALDYKRGLGSHRTPFDIDETVVLFRVEVGDNPPDCYVSHASMSLVDFAAWATDCVPSVEQGAEDVSRTGGPEEAA